MWMGPITLQPSQLTQEPGSPNVLFHSHLQLVTKLDILQSSPFSILTVITLFPNHLYPGFKQWPSRVSLSLNVHPPLLPPRRFFLVLSLDSICFPNKIHGQQAGPFGSGSCLLFCLNQTMFRVWFLDVPSRLGSTALDFGNALHRSLTQFYVSGKYLPIFQYLS